LDTSNYDYALPKKAIAQQPLVSRGSSRLLVGEEPVKHKKTKDLPDLLQEGDLLVLNETRVMPSRMRFRKATGGLVEILALEEREGGSWEALIRPSKKVPAGTDLTNDDGDSVIRIGETSDIGTRYVYPLHESMQELFHKYGEVPLPPYIEGSLEDDERYQTVFANRESSVAAPTAGLHLTEETLEQCLNLGVQVTKLELSVGIGTFRPISTEKIENHIMHGESYALSEDTWALCKQAKRVVAVGTTVVRALESVAITGKLVGRTDLFIAPGFEFKIVDALMTNFHLPRSSLLVMIDAFVGKRWKELYRIALKEDYRFLSFGDAMFVERPK
jgi:S-adenosylmethionine:tRNA ribosyltransferase-isomerase